MAAHHDPQAATARRGGVAPPRTALTRSWSAPPSTPRATPAPPTAWSQVADGARRVAGAAPRRRARAPPSRRRLARLPVRTPCAPCRGAGPTRLPRRQGQPPCPRPWINAQAHRLLVGGGGLGNPPRATARGEAAGLQGSAVLCARARAGRNTRAAAQRAGRRTQARTNSPTPARLLRDERGARPLAKAGAALPRPPSALGTGGDHASLHPRLHGVASPLQPCPPPDRPPSGTGGGIPPRP